MAHAVLHADKSSGGSTGVGEHIDRIGRHEKPENVDPERTHLNEHLVEPRSKNLTNDINARIDEGYTKTKAIRKDAVKSVRIILSGSHERMKEIESNPSLFKAWKQANLEFMSERFGKENLVRMTLHRDETTPHFHCVVVPITFDGGLSCKKMLGGPKELAMLQTDYANAMQIFELSRGKENSTAKHTDIKEYYGRVNKQENLFPEVTIPVKGLLEKEESFQKRAQKELTPIFDAMDKAKRINGQLRGDNERLKKDNSWLRKEISDQKTLGIEKANSEFLRGAKGTLGLINKALEPEKLKVSIDFERKSYSLERIKEQTPEQKKEIPPIKRDKGVSMS
jgi:hypothetical protein